MGWARMVAGVSAPEESPSCTEHGCPVKAGEAGGRPRVDSPDWRAACRARATETKPAVTAGVKRAILPAAISESAASRLLAEAGSREPPRMRRRGRSQSGAERDDHREQNSAYSPTPFLRVYGAYSSIGRALDCETRGCG